MNEWTLYFDGLTEPKNPGGAMAWGWLILRDGAETVSGSDALPAKPSNTNNIAEWLALGFGLRAVSDLLAASKCGGLLIRGDSNLVINQLAGRWNCKAEHLKKYLNRCREIVGGFDFLVTYEWIPRDENAEADALSQRGYEKLVGSPPPERKRRHADGVVKPTA